MASHTVRRVVSNRVKGVVFSLGEGFVFLRNEGVLFLRRNECSMEFFSLGRIIRPLLNNGGVKGVSIPSRVYTGCRGL